MNTSIEIFDKSDDRRVLWAELPRGTYFWSEGKLCHKTEKGSFYCGTGDQAFFDSTARVRVPEHVTITVTGR